MVPTPYDICLRLVAFAARMGDVLPSDEADMADALVEIHAATLRLVTGASTRPLPAAPIDHLSSTVAALLRHGPFTTEIDLRVAGQLTLSVEFLFEGLPEETKHR